MARAKKTQNLYEILEVSPRARPGVIKSAYDILCEEYSKGKNSARILKQIEQAKDTLLDKKKRADYDESRNDLTGKIIGNYRILEMIAEGGFGKTYKGEQVALDELVCIKHCNEISPQDDEILVEEAKSVWNLRHYSIPAMRDFLELDDGSHALVMSYIPGPTLDKIVDKNRKLDPEHVAWIAQRILNALKYLHYNGVVHGDVKPKNTIIQPENHMVVLVDYGLSMIKPSRDSESKGYTPYFASPEQERGETLLPESDFYSLGMTMIYALGGEKGSALCSRCSL
jgi:serine/threonine protein kinase